MDFCSAEHAKEYLLKQGLSVDLNSDRAKRAFYLGAFGAEGINDVKAYRKLGMPLTVCSPDEGWTALHYAARDEYAGQAFDFLINEGADLEIEDHNGRTPIWGAAQTCAPRYLQKVIEAGAKVDVFDHEGNSLLHEAAYSGFYEAVDMLLALGLDPNHQNQRGQTPLHIAAGRFSRVKLAKPLLVAGADPSIQDKNGKKPVDLLCGQHLNEDQFRSLLEGIS